MHISIKNIFLLLSIIIGGLILIFFVIWLIGELLIIIPDAKENKQRAESFYQELGSEYEASGGYFFPMSYTYNTKTNIGFFAGGGYVGINCWERYIRDAWSNEEIMVISLCNDEKITKEKLDALNEFWKKYGEIFKQ